MPDTDSEEDTDTNQETEGLGVQSVMPITQRGNCPSFLLAMSCDPCSWPMFIAHAQLALIGLTHVTCPIVIDIPCLLECSKIYCQEFLCNLSSNASGTRENYLGHD